MTRKPTLSSSARLSKNWLTPKRMLGKLAQTATLWFRRAAAMSSWSTPAVHRVGTQESLAVIREMLAARARRIGAVVVAGCLAAQAG